MADFIVSYVSGPAPDRPDEQFRRELARRTERLLAKAQFSTGMGEPLSDVAENLVELTSGPCELVDVVQHLQAAAAPASAYIPPASEFSTLAAEIYAQHRRAWDILRASA